MEAFKPLGIPVLICCTKQVAYYTIKAIHGMLVVTEETMS